MGIVQNKMFFRNYKSFMNSFYANWSFLSFFAPFDHFFLFESLICLLRYEFGSNLKKHKSENKFEHEQLIHRGEAELRATSGRIDTEYKIKKLQYNPNFHNIRQVRNIFHINLK